MADITSQYSRMSINIYIYQLGKLNAEWEYNDDLKNIKLSEHIQNPIEK